MDYLSEFFQFLPILPASVLCFLPMRHQLKIPPKKLAVILLCTNCIAILTLTILSTVLHISSNLLLFTAMFPLFYCYHKTLRSTFAQNLSIFLLVISILSFPADFALAIDAWIHPSENIFEICLLYSVCQCALSFIFTLVFSIPFYLYISKLIDSLRQSKIWYLALLIPIIIVAINIEMQPKYYATLYINRVFEVYLFLLTVALLMLILFYALFYFVATELIEAAENKIRIRLLEMQSSQYKKQQTYITENARLRHDFRQSIIALGAMADNEDFASLKTYIKNYTNALPTNEVTAYCHNISANALLNYYATQMDENHIKRNWNISLPKELSISDIELCAVLGNILENVYHGCLTLNSRKRYHNFMICVKNNKLLYIVSTNSFDGNVDLKDGIYRSTYQGGSGIGLSSIATTVEKYNGSAQFRHTQQEFIMDIVCSI